MNSLKSIIALTCITGFTSTGAFAADSFFGPHVVEAVAVVHEIPSTTLVKLAAVNASETCSFWGWHYRFDHSTPHGKAMLATLLAAKANSKRSSAWYRTSTASGTTESSGCSPDTMATLTGVSIE